jgi:hypothetical protein
MGSLHFFSHSFLALPSWTQQLNTSYALIMAFLRNLRNIASQLFNACFQKYSPKSLMPSISCPSCLVPWPNVLNLIDNSNKCSQQPLAASYTPAALIHSSRLESIESLVSIPDKGQAHLSVLLRSNLLCLRTMNSTVVFLWDLIDREVRHVDIGGQFGLERCTNASQLLPDHTSEEGVSFDRVRTIVDAAVFA